MAESYPLDGSHEYWLLLDRFPARVPAKDMVPEVNVKGKWEPYYQLTRFFAEAERISKAEFDEAVAAEEKRGRGEG